jgi:hypothetical protein
LFNSLNFKTEKTERATTTRRIKKKPEINLLKIVNFMFFIEEENL